MELRKDYILDRWVILSSARGKRPHEFVKEPPKIVEEVCRFCPGNENLTPEETFRLSNAKGEWAVRVFPNKFAATDEILHTLGDPEVKTHNTFFTFADAYGDHEIVVETRDHGRQLSDLSEQEIKQVLEVYANRIAELSDKANVKYAVLFKNSGIDAGTSIVHSHSQIISYNIVPSLIREKIEAAKRFAKCPYCDIIPMEKDSYRRCFENGNFVAFTPYASRFNYEIWILPKMHFRSLGEMNDIAINDLAAMLKQVLKKISSQNWSYNFFFHYAPRGEDLHFHIEVCPRIAVWAGFELSSETIINSVPPEEAAKWYRGEI